MAIAITSKSRTPTGAAIHPPLTTISTLTWQLACLPTSPHFRFLPSAFVSLRRTGE
jgi:hypothetical protein